MCFSASVSFGASAVLTTCGALAMHKAQTPAQKLFAITPLFFGIQQCSEGCIWLALQNPENQLLSANLWLMTTFFLIFAWIVWPFFIPFSLFKLEKVEKRKIYLKYLVFVGALVSIILANQLFSQEVIPRIVEHHILFVKERAGGLQRYTGHLYAAAVLLPFIFSSNKNIKILGAFNLVAFLIAWTVYTEFLISVWCFFAAMASGGILYVIHALNSPKQVGEAEYQMEKIDY
jgi:hypothetical protein